jgi:hypothetical protein
MRTAENPKWIKNSYLRLLLDILEDRGVEPKRDFAGLFWLDLGCGNNSFSSPDNSEIKILQKPELIEDVGGMMGADTAVGMDCYDNTGAENYHHIVYWLKPEDTADRLLTKISESTGLPVGKEKFWGVSANGFVGDNNPSPTLSMYGYPQQMEPAIFRWAKELLVPQGFLMIDRMFYQKQADGSFTLIS